MFDSCLWNHSKSYHNVPFVIKYISIPFGVHAISITSKGCAAQKNKTPKGTYQLIKIEFSCKGVQKQSTQHNKMSAWIWEIVNRVMENTRLD